MSLIHSQAVGSCVLNTINVDILRRIPDCYRTWQLLRLTCVTLYKQLGDYHTARDIIMLHNGLPVSYNVFIATLITNLCNIGADPNAVLSMHQVCNLGPTMYLSGHESTRIIDNVLVKWVHEMMTFYRYNYNYGCLIYLPTTKNISNYISIGKHKYYALGGWKRFIYDELPEMLQFISRIYHPVT